MIDEERLADIVAPALELHGASLYDVTFAGGVLRVAADADGGIDADALSKITRAVSVLLDEADPIGGSYTLEVSSPGLERKLRTPRHFADAVGHTVSVTARPEGPAIRFRGELVAADDTSVTVRDDDGDHLIGLDTITKATTVFEWGPAPKPGGPGSGTTSASEKKRKAAR